MHIRLVRNIPVHTLNPVHYLEPHTYHVPCGEGDKIFGEGHGGSVYVSEVTCDKCKSLLEAKEEKLEGVSTNYA